MESIFNDMKVQYGQKITLKRSKQIGDQTIGYYRGHSNLNPNVHFIKMKDDNYLSWFKLKHIKELHQPPRPNDN